MKRLMFITLMCAFVAVPAGADLIQNGSFENGNFVEGTTTPFIMPLAVGATDITGWTVVSDEIAWVKGPNPYGVDASDGFLLLDLTGFNDSPPHGGVSQTISTSLGQNYRLSLDLGTLTGPASVTVSAGSASETFTHNPTGSGNQWQSFSCDFSAIASSTLVTITGADSGDFIGLDNVSVVPVPGAVLLGILGLGAAGLKLRKFA